MDTSARIVHGDLVLVHYLERLPVLFDQFLCAGMVPSDLDCSRTGDFMGGSQFGGISGRLGDGERLVSQSSQSDVGQD